MTPPVLLRAAVLALLAALLALPSIWNPKRAGTAVAWLDAAPAGRAADSLLVGAAPPLIARASSAPPADAELGLLAAAAARAPLYVALPADWKAVEIDAPARAVAGRAAAIPFRVRAEAAESVTVRLSDETGVLDSVRVRTDGAGQAAAAFRVRPPRAGWREWTVEAGGRTAATGAWVDSAGPPRVLVRMGFPGWESKFVVRALEESGAVVETAKDLGRGLMVGQGGGGAVTPERLARFDAAVVLDGAPVSEAERRALADWAARGGGVLVTGDRAGMPAIGVVRDDGEATGVNGTGIRWTAPPEVATLPADRVASSAAPFDALAAGSALAAAATQGGILALRPLGRGRAAALALTETWRWRMEAGRVAEHREFWRALVDWLASAPRDPLSLRVPQPIAAPGAAAEVLVFDARPDASAPVPPLVVGRPGGRADTVALARDASRPGVLRARVVPAAPGLYTFALAGRAPGAAMRVAADTAAAADPWARLALLASRSGGAALPADSLRPVVNRLSAGLPGGGGRGPSPWLLFALLVLAGGAEWAIRRLSGRA